MTWLDASPFVEKTSLFGTAVHAVVRAGSGSVDRLKQALAESGQPFSSVQSVVPSLEDVFLDVVDRLERGRAA
jgi:hypothetical protein